MSPHIAPLTVRCGDQYSPAPELLLGPERDAQDSVPYSGMPVDVWGLGVVLYTLLCSRVPFDGPTLEVLREASLCSPVGLRFPRRVSRGTFFFLCVGAECLSLIRRFSFSPLLPLTCTKKIVGTFYGVCSTRILPLAHLWTRFSTTPGWTHRHIGILVWCRRVLACQSTRRCSSQTKMTQNGFIYLRRSSPKMGTTHGGVYPIL